MVYLEKELHTEGVLIEAHSLVNVVNPDCYLANLIERDLQGLRKVKGNEAL